MRSVDDTIAAIGSAAGGAARGVVRVSGPGTLAALAACFSPLDSRAFDGEGPRVIAGYLHISSRAPADLSSSVFPREDGALLGKPAVAPGNTTKLPCDVYYWPTARSYTRQPSAELHLPGSPPLLAAALRVLFENGVRPAEPGEFTLRAFLAGRLDLTQAEAVLGVIDATGKQSLNAALAQMAGGVGRPLHGLRESLLDLLAHLEAGLDFAEEDISFISPTELRGGLQRAAGEVAAMLEQMASRQAAVDILRVALIGRPNVGKSSLFNALAPGAAALVSARPGTTRDYLTARLDLQGAACELIDTAGAEESASQPLAAAQAMTEGQRRDADARLLCLDATREPDAWERGELSSLTAADLVAFTKCDHSGAVHAGLAVGERREPPVATSAHVGLGLTELKKNLRRLVLEKQGETSVVLSTAARAGESLRLAGEALDRAGEVHQAGGGEELIAAEIRVALEELGKVVGAICTDDILDRVFSRFCLGK